LKKNFRLLWCLIWLAFTVKAQAPIANFSVDQLTICVGQSIQFSNLSSYNGSNIVSTNWNFGEGSVSNLADPSHVYNTAGTFNVILTVITSGGTDTEDKAAYIKVNPLPISNFTITGDKCKLPYNGVIVNTSSTGNNYTYNWTFSNGVTSSDLTPPTLSTTSAGSYTVDLFVTNTTTGCTNLKSSSLSINNYIAAINAPNTACYLNPLVVNDASSIGTNSWVWVAGNGQTSSSQNPTFNYAAPGTYNLQLTAQNTTIGCSKTTSQSIIVQSTPSPHFTMSTSGGCAPLNVNFTNLSTTGIFNWDFGNGTTYSGQTPPTKTFTTNGNYVVRLTMTSNQGCTGITTVTDTVKIASPTPYIKVNRRGGCAPLSVQFEDSSYTSNPSQDPIVSWVWDLGDGTSYLGQTPPIHTYPIGKYDITLTVTTQNGCTKTTLFNDYIAVGVIDLVNFNASPTIGCARQNYSFTNLSSITASHLSQDVTFKWNFGDGGKSLLENPVYTFPIDTGFFDVKLIVNFNGCKDSLIKVDQIYIKTPISKFSVDTLICNPSSFPLRVPVKDLSTVGKGGDDVQMIWRWEGIHEYNLPASDVFDANKGDTAYVFNNYGSYNVKQIVKNITIGCTDSTQKTIVISKLIPDFIMSNDTLCFEEIMTLNSTSILTNGPGFFSYNLGNGIVKNGNPISYTYANSGKYNITLKAFNSAGCIVSKAYNNIVHLPKPSATFTPSAIGDQCLPLTVNYSNTSVKATPVNNYKWILPDGSRQTTTQLNEPVSYNFSDKGTYTTSLQTEDVHGCLSEVTSHIVGITKPEINFSMDSVYCNNIQIMVPNTTIGFGNLNFRWLLDNQQFSSDTNFRITFNDQSNQTSQSHLVNLIVTDQKGCKDSIEHSIHVSLPKIDFGYIPSGASVNNDGEYLCPPVFANFSDSSESYGQINSWTWTFGDGKSSSLKNPSNTYLYPGIYSVGFEIEDNFGCSTDTLLVDFITIHGPSLNPTFINTNSSCGNEFNFIAQNLNPLDKVSWNMNDGSIISDSTNFLYTYNSGIYNPIAIVVDPLGCEVSYQLPAISISTSNFTSNAGPDIITCTNQTVLNASPVLNSSFTGKWVVVSGSVLVNDINSPTSSVTNIGTSENILIWKVSDGCTYVNDTLSIINGFSSINAGNNQSICSYSTALEANQPLVGIGSWSSQDLTISFDDIHNPTTTSDNLKNGVNNLIWTINSICGSTRDTVEIFVQTPPSPSNAGSNDSTCISDYTLQANLPLNGTGNWSLISGSGTIKDSSNPFSLVTGLGFGDNIFEWRIDNNCNFSTSQVIIRKLELPTTASCGIDTVF